MKTKHYIHACLLVLLSLLAGCRNSHTDSRFAIKLEPGIEGDTYSIIDTVTDSLIYESGHYAMKLKTVLDGYCIFYEDIITEDCSGRFVVYNPEEDLMMRAGFYWGYDVPKEIKFSVERDIKDDIYEIESLDFTNRVLTVEFFNGNRITLDLEGEKHGNYWVTYSVTPNETIAQEVTLSPEESMLGEECVMVWRNNTIYSSVYYKGKLIAEPVIESTSFKGIVNPETYVLAPTKKVWFRTEGDELVANTGMYMPDTDCGYETEMLIDSLGNISLHYVVSEDLMGFQDCFNEIRDTVSLDYLAEHTVLMDFYKEPSSSPEDYAYLFVYCLDNTDECSSEAVSYGLYEVFARYPAKFRELDQFLKQLPVAIEKDIKIRLMDRIAFEATIRDEGQKRPSVDEFMSQFPYFNDPDCRDRYCDPVFY